MHHAKRAGNAAAWIVLALLACLFWTTPTRAAGCYTLEQFGAVANDGVDDLAAWNSAKAAMGGSGCLELGVGEYTFSGPMTFTIQPSKGFAIFGKGSSISKLRFTGNGLDIVYGGKHSSVNLEGFAVKNGRPGAADTAIKLSQMVECDSLPGFAPGNEITDVSIYGSDGLSATDYFGYGIRETNINNISIYHVVYNGSASKQGVGMVFEGVPSFAPCGGNPSYSVAINVINSFLNTAQVGILYGNHVQGLAVISSNMTQAGIGIFAPPGIEDNINQLTVIGSQFGGSDVAINLQSNLNATLISGNYFIIGPNQKGVLIASQEFTITGNVFAGTGAANNRAIECIPAAYPSLAGNITGNTFNDTQMSVLLAAGCNTTNVQSNTYRNIFYPVLNYGSGNTVGGGSP